MNGTYHQQASQTPKRHSSTKTCPSSVGGGRSVVRRFFWNAKPGPRSPRFFRPEFRSVHLHKLHQLLRGKEVVGRGISIISWFVYNLSEPCRGGREPVQSMFRQIFLKFGGSSGGSGSLGGGLPVERWSCQQIKILNNARCVHSASLLWGLVWSMKTWRSERRSSSGSKSVSVRSSFSSYLGLPCHLNQNTTQDVRKSGFWEAVGSWSYFAYLYCTVAFFFLWNFKTWSILYWNFKRERNKNELRWLGRYHDDWLLIKIHDKRNQINNAFIYWH